MRGKVSAHEIYTAANKHSDPTKVYRGSTDVINEFAKLDVAGIWGDGQVVAVDGSQVDTWENNLLAESHIRYGGYGGIAMRHVADSYVALFSHFIPCGVWEAVYIIEGLLNNDSDIQPDTVHADTNRARILLAHYADGLRLHQIRHSSATHLGEANTSANVIMAKTGHKSLRSIQRYVKPGLAAVHQATETLSSPRRRG
jgi:hypothetical protein